MQTDFIPVPKRGALLVNPKKLARIEPTMFPRRSVVTYNNKKWVVIPLDEATYVILSRHGVTPPSPMRSYYEWPGRYVPFEHQRCTAEFLTQHKRAFVLNGFGTGKTLATLWALDYLMERGLCKSAIIVAPLSTLDRVWGDSVFENLYHRTFRIIHGSAQKRKKLLSQPADFYIINHDGLGVVRDDLNRRSDITHCVVDELAVFRNKSTGKYKILWDLYGPESGRSFWGLTGAPMPRSPTDIWAQARLVNPNLVPKYFGRLRDMLMHQITQFKWVPKRGWEEKAFSMLQPSVRYTVEDNLDLPSLTYTTRQVAMSPKQQKVYDELAKVCKSDVAEGTVTALNAGVMVGKLLQVATGAVYTDAKGTVNLDPAPKLNELVELVYEADRKIIVFTPFKHSLKLIEKHLKKVGFSVGVVSGDVSKSARDKIFSEFQHGDLEVLLAHPKCMAHGLTLTRSSTIVWFAPIDDLEIQEQADARIRRAGQTKPQTIVRLQCSQIEQRVYERSDKKEKMQGILLDLFATK